MPQQVTLTGFERSLREAGLRHERLALAGGYSVVVTERWGKIFGPFVGDEPGTLWNAPKTGTTAGLNDLVETGEWCVGGDRIWFAPEVQFNIPDRNNWDSGGSYVLPKEVDPGNYRLVREGAGISLEQTVMLKLYNTAIGSKDLHVKRTVMPARDPLRAFGGYAALRGSLSFTGYSQLVELTDLSGGASGVETWDLAQFRGGGTVVMPLAGAVEAQDYYQPVTAEYFRVKNSTAYLRLTGDHKYKVGFKAPGVTGRIGHFTRMGQGVARLVIIAFFSNPSSNYIDEPSGAPEAQGDSVQFFNDDGGLGGFSEIEIHGMSVGGESGRTTATDSFEFWQYSGQEKDITEIARLLLGTADMDFQ